MATANPYVVPGLYAVCQQIFLGFSQSMADHAAEDGLASQNGNMNAWNNVVNANANADTTWNAAIGHVVKQGWTVAKAWQKSQKGQGGLMQDPKFTQAQLQDGCDFASTYLQYK